MTTHRWMVPTALLVSVSVLAAACGGDNSSGSSGATTAAPATTAAAAATTAAGATTTAAGGAATTAAAAAQGGVIPDKGSGKYGVDPSNPKHYVGPSGFELDLTKCPSDWNINQGIS